MFLKCTKCFSTKVLAVSISKSCVMCAGTILQYLHCGDVGHRKPGQSSSLTATHCSERLHGNPAQGLSHSHVGQPVESTLKPYWQTWAQIFLLQEPERLRPCTTPAVNHRPFSVHISESCSSNIPVECNLPDTHVHS